MVGSLAEYGINVTQDVMVPMRDGVRLAADIYRPTLNGELAPGEFPTILGRTSYDKSNPVMWIEAVANFFTPRGYAVVLQDLRGRGQSDGTGQYFHTVNPREGQDGYDTVEWVAAQGWSSGKIGTVGSSHGGKVQTAMALERPPHLTAMWADVNTVNFFDGTGRVGGAMALHMFGAMHLHAFDAQEIRDDLPAQRKIMEAMEQMRDWVFKTPFKPGHTALAAVPNLEKTFFNYYYRGEFDEFWSQECNDYVSRFDRHAEIPLTISGGWYDAVLRSTHTYASAMLKRPNVCTRLIFGPWTHTSMRGTGASFAGDVDFGLGTHWGDKVYNEERLRWFDRWLKDIQTGVEDEPPVRIFVMGGGDGSRDPAGRLNHAGRWRQENEWPLVRAAQTPYHLRAGGLLTLEEPAEDDASASYAFDPAHPVPTVAGSVTGFYELVKLPDGIEQSYVSTRARMRNIVTSGGAHQKEEPGILGSRPPYPLLSERSDVLVFQTPVLTDDLEVTGPITVRLWVSSSAVDTDFTARLMAIYPPSEDYPSGYHLNLVDSIIRGRYRNGFEKAELMEPGQVYEVGMDLTPISNLFKAGQRIRLDISSSNFPRFDLNPNTGEPLGRHTHQLVARNTVYFDRERPSQVVLPIIPRG
jgi:putative CocE/NonD family hydrolase